MKTYSEQIMNKLTNDAVNCLEQKGFILKIKKTDSDYTNLYSIIELFNCKIENRLQKMFLTVTFDFCSGMVLIELVTEIGKLVEKHKYNFNFMSKNDFYALAAQLMIKYI